MGREIRRVPADWEHPKYTEETANSRSSVRSYRPLYDNDFQSAADDWLVELDQWRAGEHPSQPCGYCNYFWEYSSPPDEEMHRERKWTEAEATHFQMYETVSEGTPVTPSFATKEGLVEYLVEHGDYWDQSRGTGGWRRENAEQFVESEWAPSMMMLKTDEGTTIKEPRDGM